MTVTCVVTTNPKLRHMNSTILVIRVKVFTLIGPVIDMICTICTRTSLKTVFHSCQTFTASTSMTPKLIPVIAIVWEPTHTLVVRPSV